MSTTVQEVLYDARALLDEYTDDGVVISTDDLPDLMSAGLRFVNMGQKELYGIGRIQKTIELTCKPVTNALGSEFEFVEFTGEDQYYPNESGVANIKSYYLEADRTHTVYIEEHESGVWSVLKTLSATGSDLVTYKGNLTPTTTGNSVRIRFSGSTYYMHINRALYEYAFMSDEAVPDYTPWVEYELPSDFRMMDVVVKEESINTYGYACYKLEQPNRFYYDREFDGKLRIIYKPVPTKVTAVTDLLEIDDIVAEALSFYVASWLAPSQKQSLTNTLFQKYLELRLEYESPEAVSEESIIDDYNEYGGMYNANIYSS